MEQLLDLIVNEEMDKANELFHEIVVEKSREIYENLIAEEEDESVEEASDEDESIEEDEDESVEEAFGMDDDESSSEIGGDAGDSFAAGIEDPEAMGGDEMGGDEEPASKADVMDLKDALEELTREFEALVNGEESDDMDMGADDSDDEESDDEESDDDESDDESDDEESDDDESMGLREYRETVGNDWHKNSMKSPGPVGSGKGELAGQTSVDGGKSPVASGKGKPTTGATAHNILGDSKTGEGTNTGTTPNGKTGGLVGGVKGEFTKGVEKNIASKSTAGMQSGSKLNKVSQNSKNPGPVGSGKGELAGQTSVGKVMSPLNGAPNRNA